MRRTVTALVSLLALFATGCSLASSEIYEACLVYSGGIVEDKAYESILPAGSTNTQIGLGSTTYCYRTDQRTWLGQSQGGDTGPVQVVSRDSVRMMVEFQLYFTLNQDEEILRRFHEDIGVKTEAWTPEGWTAMLNQYFGPQVERALESAALDFTWRELYSSEEARRSYQSSAVQDLRAAIREVIGDDYFCGPNYSGPGDSCGNVTFTVGKPEPSNDSIVTAVEQEQTNQAAVDAQRVENERIQTELEARRAEVELYGAEVYAYIQAIRAAEAAGVAPPPFFGHGVDEPTAFIDVTPQAVTPPPSSDPSN